MSMGRFRIWLQRVGFVFVITVALVACTPLAQFGVGTTSIAAINSNPAGYETVFIRGEVLQSIGAFGRGAYQVSDGENTIWVVTEAGLPSNSIRVTVEGEVVQGITIAGRNLGVTLREKQRLSGG